MDNYQLKQNRKLTLTNGYNRTVMTAIVEYFFGKEAKIYQLLKQLDVHCQNRNEYVHQLKGINTLESNEILFSIKQILNLLDIDIKPNPFEEINHKIYALLDAQQ